MVSYGQKYLIGPHTDDATWISDQILLTFHFTSPVTRSFSEVLGKWTERIWGVAQWLGILVKFAKVTNGFGDAH